MNHRQWKKNYKKQYGYNPPAYMDKRKRRKARAQQSLPCAGISVEQITQAMATFTEAVFTAAGNMCNALAQAFSRQAQAFNAVADQYKDDKAEGFTATPYIKITGSGGITLYVNNRAHTFKDVNEYIEIDGEIMNAYKGDLLQNSKMVTTLFPKLVAGANNISWAGNVTKVEIIPRWCRL